MMHEPKRPFDEAMSAQDLPPETGLPPRRCALQDWVMGLTIMQQSVLISSIRGPDGIHKDHLVKRLCRWLRRCVLISAFDRRVLTEPFDRGERNGGSFTGASCLPEGDFNWEVSMDLQIDDYLRHVDELPHHFQLHFMHAAEILGYKHPTERTRIWWNRTYLRLVNDMHLQPESEEVMDRRLGDNEHQWRSAEEVTAK